MQLGVQVLITVTCQLEILNGVPKKINFYLLTMNLI